MSVPEPLASEVTVLVADDDSLVCRLASRVLTDEGYLILVAGDGQQALEASRAHLGPLHLVLSDVKMPRLTGPELGGDFEYADVQPIRRVSGYCGIVFRD